jgi:D-glycero-alpha-D-manno-heptose-7-phosphate kinase
MIITKTPYRISFFGGGSDYEEWFKKDGNYGEVISTTIDKNIYITLRELPKFFNYKYRASYAIIEEKNLISEIKHRAIKGALRYYSLKNADIHYAGDLPARSGMGSSSSFVTGLKKEIYELKKKKITKKSLYKESVFFERSYLKELVGYQDQIAASYGGFNCIKMTNNGISLKNLNNSHNNFTENLNKNLYLVYTGKNRIAPRIVKTFIHKLSNERKHVIQRILNHVNQAKKMIVNNSPDDFGSLLDETWHDKKQLSSSVSNDFIDSLYLKAKKYGSLGGKLLGAGGGGFMIFYVTKKNKEKFLHGFKNEIIVPFRFSMNGSQIIQKNLL